VGSTEAFERMSPASIQQAVSCNVTAPMLLARLVLPDMLRKGSGTIVNMSSVCVHGLPCLHGCNFGCADMASLMLS
jgi:short-subunit dehydrogenase